MDSMKITKRFKCKSKIPLLVMGSAAIKSSITMAKLFIRIVMDSVNITISIVKFMGGLQIKTKVSYFEYSQDRAKNLVDWLAG
jgi:hypothetical protein